MDDSKARGEKSILRVLPGIALAAALAVLSYTAAGLPYLKIMGPLTLALVLGIALRLMIGLPAWAGAGTAFSGRTLLRLGIVLLGARLNFALLAQVGPKVLALDAAVIVCGIAGIAWLGRRLGLAPKLALLLAVGTSVCGASAVVAAGSVAKAEESEITLAVALCGILGTAGVFFYVLGAPFFSLSNSQLAILSGSTLHEVAQVMAAAFTWGASSGDLATLVKLTRVVLLAPALLVLAFFVGRSSNAVRFSWKNPPVPWFVGGFLGVGAAGSTGLLSPDAARTFAIGSVLLMTVAMAAMGLNTEWKTLRQAGRKVLYAGIAGFGALVGLSFGLIRLMRIQ